MLFVSFFDISDSRMLPIIDNVLNGLPVRDTESIKFLQRNRNYGKNFVRSYDIYGNWFYHYDPVEVQRLRIKNVEDGFKMEIKDNVDLIGVTEIHYKGKKATYFDKFGNIKNVRRC